MSHTEYQNWIDYDKENLSKKNIIKYIDMYEKYTLKRLREIVKHHNKMVRKEAMIMKKKEIKDNVIKVTEYKTKETLIARMKKSKKYHEQYLLGLQEAKPKQEQRIQQEAEQTLKTYKELLKNDKEEAKQYLNYKAFDINKLSEAFGVDRVGTMTEFKNDIKKQAKADMKPAKQSPKIKGISAEGQAQFEKLVKSADPKASKTALKALVRALKTRDKREKVVKQAEKVKKTRMIKPSGTVRFTQRSNPPTQLQNFIFQLAKVDNPKKMLDALYKKYEEDGPAPKSDPKPAKPKPAKPVPKKMSDSDQLFIIGNQLIEDLTEKVQESKKNKFGKDYKKFNKARANLISDFKEKSKKNKVSASEVDRYFKEILLGELEDLAQLYINVNTLVYEAHVMPDGKIMENKKMDSKKEQVSAVQNKDAQKQNTKK